MSMQEKVKLFCRLTEREWQYLAQSFQNKELIVSNANDSIITFIKKEEKK
jgi:hypothetical protein